MVIFYLVILLTRLVYFHCTSQLFIFGLRAVKVFNYLKFYDLSSKMALEVLTRIENWYIFDVYRGEEAKMENTLNININLNMLNAEELAALRIALRGHISNEQNAQIVNAGFCNCGPAEYGMLESEVKFCHDERLSMVTA